MSWQKQYSNPLLMESDLVNCFNKYRYQKMFVFQELKQLSVTKGLTKFVLPPYVIMLHILQVHDQAKYTKETNRDVF